MNDVTHERFLEAVLEVHAGRGVETPENAAKRKVLMPWFDKMSFDMGFATALGWLESELWPDSGVFLEQIQRIRKGLSDE